MWHDLYRKLKFSNDPGVGKTGYIRWLFSNEQWMNDLFHILHIKVEIVLESIVRKKLRLRISKFSASPDPRFWSHFLRRGRAGILFEKMMTPYCNYNYAILPTFTFSFNLFVLFFTYSIFSFNGTVLGILNCTYFVEFYIKSRAKQWKIVYGLISFIVL